MVVRFGASIAVVRGEIELPEGIRMVIREELSFESLPGRIRGYGYEVWKDREQLYWYDSQPHPNNPDLAATHPHHKHIHPNIKRHRILAPGLSFIQPNLPFLLEEIKSTLLS